jgi:glutamate 5-kinase
LEWGGVPILNENDAVANEEIKFGDNDSLSARVSKVIEADRLVILTDVDGLYDADPRANPSARLVPSIPGVTKKLLSATQTGAGSKRGTGGMYSKLLAAQLASKEGIVTYLVKGDLPGVLEGLAGGKPLGTRIGDGR